ncbi:MAG TPA: PilZ domain-containing protein [Gammaproteobacteria bacterium]|nr:PilZ domain-containing protein [Gammaproteobacteria bacterium]
MSAPDPVERRRFKRFRFHSVIRLRRDDESCECTLLDVSFRGFLARCPAGWRVFASDRLRVEWRLAELITLEMDAEVMHVNGVEVGCSWQARDAESFAHLKRLVEMNLVNPKLVARELEALKAEPVRQFGATEH